MCARVDCGLGVLENGDGIDDELMNDGSGLIRHDTAWHAYIVYGIPGQGRGLQNVNGPSRMPRWVV